MEREENQKFGALAKQVAKAALDDENEKIAQRQEAARANADYLRRQMNERSRIVPGKYGHVAMNNVERAMNRDVLERAIQGDGLKLLQKHKEMELRMAGGVQTTK